MAERQPSKLNVAGSKPVVRFMSLKSLQDHNREKTAAYGSVMPIYPRPNGIACPKCGKEMVDTDGMIRTSIPPKTQVACVPCKYYDFRVL